MPQELSPPQENATADAEVYGVYQTVRLLGEGASGRVFLAERTDFPQRVALKVFHPEFLASGLGSPAESRLLASLDHRHIVRVLQHGVTSAGVRYLAMEYVAGEDILAFCEAHSLSPGARIGLILQVLDAVDYAHRHLVLHGDLKPANILVATDPGEAKVVDFGSAIRLQDEIITTSLTRSFASPEQRAGGRVTAASDIYSLGLLARQIVAGIPPAEPAAELPSRIVLRLGVRSVLAPGALRGDLDATLGKALQPAPEDRYASAEAFAADLRAYADGRTPAVRDAPLLERLFKWTRRHKVGAAMAAFLAATLVFSVTGVAVKAMQARRSRAEAQARLRELVRLTGTLQSELYGPVRSLPHSADAEKLLTDSAASTLDRLAASHPTDPTLRSELASQYAQLAHLELEQAHNAETSDSALTTHAAGHLRQALEILPPESPQRADILRQLNLLVPFAAAPRSR